MARRSTPAIVALALLAAFLGNFTPATADEQVVATRFGLPSTNVRTSGVGWRNSTDSFHYGIDFSSRDAEDRIVPLDFTAGVSGTVTVHENSRWNTISVRLANGNVVQYLHASRVYVNSGDKVAPNTRLGRTGDVGSPGSLHLHIQARDRDGKYIDPDRAVLGASNVRVGP
jgi:murein DD-endopeptidase MepM/ murein hydrolase activator NlpD